MIVARNISVLIVSSRFARSKTIRGGCHAMFPGYGECMHMKSQWSMILVLPAAELYIRGKRAYLLRLGINPQVRHRVNVYWSHNPLYTVPPVQTNQR